MLIVCLNNIEQNIYSMHSDSSWHWTFQYQTSLCLIRDRGEYHLFPSLVISSCFVPLFLLLALFVYEQSYVISRVNVSKM